jgi:hypothetical protein
MPIVIDRRQGMVNLQDCHEGRNHHDGQEHGERDRSRGLTKRASDGRWFEQDAHGQEV